MENRAVSRMDTATREYRLAPCVVFRICTPPRPMAGRHINPIPLINDDTGSPGVSREFHMIR